MDKEQTIVFQMRTLLNLIKRNVDRGGIDEGEKEMTSVQGWIIRYIYEHREEKDIFQKDIEKAFNIRRSTATVILQTLERNGYLFKEAVQGDKRLKKLCLTSKAIERHKKVRLRLDEIEMQLRKGLSKEEIDTLLEVLQKLKGNMKSFEQKQ